MDRRVVSVLAVATLLVVAGLLAVAGGGGVGLFGDDGTGDGDDRERACVTIVDAESGTVEGRVEAAVADTPDERYRGLSGTDSLANGSGMLFVFADESERSFVMREMNYPIDMVFVGADGRITRIFHAPVEHDDSLTTYSSPAKWVLEVPLEWTTRHGVTAGDEVRIEYECGDPSLGTRTT